MSQGFRKPWSSGGGYAQPGRRRVVRGLPEWWKDLPPGSPNYDRLAQSAAMLLQNQFTLIRRKQLAQKALPDGAEVPAWMVITDQDTNFMLKATDLLSKARGLVLKEKVAMNDAMATVKRKNPFEDPRGEVVGAEDEAGWEADGRQGA